MQQTYLIVDTIVFLFLMPPFVLIQEHVNCWNVSTINNLLESIRSGNFDAKDLVKKLKSVQSSMASVEATESFPLKEKNSPPLVSPSKAGKFENLLAKYSTPSKVSKLQNSLDESSALGQGCHLESRAVSQLKATKHSSTSSKPIIDKVLDHQRETVRGPAGKKNHKRTNMVKMEVNLKEGNLDCNINKDGKKISDTSDMNLKATNTKSKPKKKIKVKVETDFQTQVLVKRGNWQVTL